MTTNIGQAEGKKVTCEGQTPKEIAILPKSKHFHLIYILFKR